MANQRDSKQFLNKLQGLFNLAIRKEKGFDTFSAVPGELNKETGKTEPIKLTSEVQKYLNWWLRSVHDSPATLKNRLDRYKDLDYMYYNDTIVSAAIELYADETVQFDAESQPLIINAENKKVISYIQDLFDKIGINRQSLREIARNLALYGDAFTVNSIKEGIGYTFFQVVDVTTVLDRIEFNAVTVKKEMQRYMGLQNLLNRENRLQILADTLRDMGSEYDSAKFYKSYLFGFQLEGDIFLPPWAVSHFKLYSSKSEFFPFGRPILINSISPFRQLKASKNLMAMARAAKFPKEHFEIETDETMTQAEKWNAVNEARQEYQNISQSEGSKEDFSVGGQIWTPKGALAYNLLENSLKLDDIADIELLREDIIIGTRIPKGYLIVDRGSWGSSGQSLLQQYKPFGRSVLTVQTAILEELVKLVKMQFIISGDYDEDTPFTLEMHFPIIEDSSDRLRMKTETLSLAKTIIDNLTSVLGINSKLPTDVIKDIFKQYSFLGTSNIDDWITQIDSENEKLSEKEEIKLGRINENIVREAYFKSMKDLNIQETIKNGKHLISSFASNIGTNDLIETYKLKAKKSRKVKV